MKLKTSLRATPVFSLKILMTLLLTLSFGFSLFSFATPMMPPEDEKVIINKKVQHLSFFLNRKKELNAKLSVSELVSTRTTLAHTFSRAVFFDDNSEVDKIRQKINSKKRKTVDPIISDYESDGIFHSDLKLCYFEHKFAENGEKVLWTYEKLFYDLKFLDPLYFNDPYFVEESEIIIEIPNWLKIDIRELNFDLEDADHQVTKEKKSTIHRYTQKACPASFRHNSAPRRSKYNAHLIVIPNAYEAKGKNRKLIETVDDLYGWYASLVQEIGNDSKGLKTLVAKLTKGKTEDLDKIKAIYYWVQDNIRYIAFENGIMGFKPESCQKVYGNKYGDCKGMANLTKEMLQIAGYDARLTWLGTSDIPYSYDIPALVVDNHMICTVILNGEKIFLDPTEKFGDLYNYAFRIQGQEALIEDGDKFIIEKIPSFELAHSKQVSEQNLVITGTQLAGQGTINYTGNRKTSMLYGLSRKPKEDWKDYLIANLSNGDKNVKIDLKTEVSLARHDDDFKLAYDLKLDNHIIDLEGEQYLNLELDHEFRNFTMSEERDVPYEFSGKYFIENTTTLAVPEGWSVSYLPTAMAEDQEKYNFSLSYEKEAGKLIYHKKIIIKNPLLTVADFETWNKSIEALNAFYADQIILTKK